jgi:hypothetical protein
MAKRKGITDKELDEMAALEFEAALSDEQVDEIERAYESTWGVRRRMMQIALARSSSQLKNSEEHCEAADAFIAMTEELDKYKDHLLNALELTEAAIARSAAVAAYHTKLSKRH